MNTSISEAENPVTVGCVILAGGKSSRMGGENKALLKMENRTYLERIASELSFFEECFLSGGSPELADLVGFKHVPDLFPDCGPMAGVYSALCRAESSALFVVPCDMPNFHRALADCLIAELTADDAGIIYEDGSYQQPLCGIYTKKCMPVMKACLENGKMKMRLLSKDICIRTVPLPSELVSETLFRNVNSKNDIPG